MNKLKVLLFHFLPNGAHYNFFKLVVAVITNASYEVKHALGLLEADLNFWFAREFANLEWIRKSAFSDAIAAANHRLDHALSGLLAQVNAARFSALPNVALAAERLHHMLISYGTVAKKSYQDEIGDVDAILGHLNGDFAADVNTTGVGAWIPEIIGAQAEFSDLLKDRQSESLEKPPTNFRETRHEIEKVWRQIATVIDGGAAMHISDDFADIINKINPEIDDLNHAYHHAKHDIAHILHDDIPPQQYTGLPLTPVPTGVRYITAKGEVILLVLGKDFNVTYKDNIEAGSAECIIHGKGKFRGHKIISFTITG